MSAALRAEIRKWTTTRLWWILLLVMAGYMAFIGGVLAFSLVAAPAQQGGPTLEGERLAVSIYATGNGLGYVFPLLVGALAMTSEFRYQTITPSLLAEPRRTVFLVAKTIVAFGTGLLFGLVGTLAVVAAAAPVLAWKGPGTYLTSADVLVPMVLSVVALAFWAVIGVGVGTLITNQVAAIVVVLAWTQFVEPIVRVGMGAVDALAPLARFLPASASDALVGASTYAAAVPDEAALLSRPAGAAVFLAYGIVLLALGRVTTLRRDIT